jgi:hypothetical protein
MDPKSFGSREELMQKVAKVIESALPLEKRNRTESIPKPIPYNSQNS